MVPYSECEVCHCEAEWCPTVFVECATVKLNGALQCVECATVKCEWLPTVSVKCATVKLNGALQSVWSVPL